MAYRIHPTTENQWEITPTHRIIIGAKKAANTTHQQAKSVEELPLLLSVSDIMKSLGIGRNTAYTLIRSGQLKSIRVGRLIKIPRSALEEYLRSY